MQRTQQLIKANKQQHLHHDSFMSESAPQARTIMPKAAAKSPE